MITVDEFLKLPTRKQERDALWQRAFEEVLDRALKESAKDKPAKIEINYEPFWIVGEYFLKDVDEASFVKDVLVPVVNMYRECGWTVWFMEEDRYKEATTMRLFKEIGRKIYTFTFTRENSGK